jgi:4-amino-4-deoxy-L-arabinose transferase-like glycosyltransferase
VGGFAYVYLAALACAALALRVYRLDFQSLWRDEVDAVIFATRDLDALLSMFSSVGDNGPLFFLGLRLWIGLAGQSEFAIRFPSAVAGVLAVLVTYRLGLELIGREAGLIGAVLMAVSPYHIWYGQEAKMYALISFLAPLSLLVLMRALRGGRRWLWAGWVALMAAFLYVHLFALVMLVVGLVWLPLLLRSRPRVSWSALAVLGAVVLATLPVVRWLAPAALTPADTGYYPYSLGEMATILLFNFSMGLRPTADVWPVGIFALLLAAGCAPLIRAPKADGWPHARGVLLLLLYLVVPLLAIWLVSLRRPTFTDRYLIITLPAFCLLMATGVVAISTVLGARLRLGAAPSGQGERLATAGLVVLAVVGALPFVWRQTHNIYKADFRGATAFVEAQAAPDDLIIFLMPYVQRSFAYYHPQSVRSVEPPYTRGMSPLQVDAEMRSRMQGNRRVWLFLSEQEFWDPDGLIPAWFERNAVRACQQEFAYIEVRCYDLRP